MALKEFMDGNDILVVLHVSDPSKDYLPEEFLPEAIVKHHKTFLLSNVRRFNYQLKNIFIYSG